MNNEIGSCRTLTNIAGIDYTLIFGDYEIEAVLLTVGKNDRNPTGLITKQENGEFVEVWATEYSRPFDIIASYERIY